MWREATSTATWWEAGGVWAAVLVALFLEPVRDWLRRPKLVLRRAPRHLNVQKTNAYLPVPIEHYGRRPVVPCYYCHLEVANAGKRVARKVEVFLREVHRREEGGTWVLEGLFIPEWLLWMTIRNLTQTGLPGIYLPTLPPKARRYLDLAHMYRTQDRSAFPGQNDPELPPEQTLLSLDVAITYLRAGHLLRAGQYRLTLEVAAENAEPQTFQVEVAHNGQWYENETAMLLSGGIQIGEVRPIRI